MYKFLYTKIIPPKHRIIKNLRSTVFYLLIFIITTYSIGPLLWQFITSLKPSTELTMLPPLLPAHPTLNHYITIFKNYSFFKIIINSLLVSLTTTCLSLVFGSLAAFALAKFNIYRAKLILISILSISMFPPIATVSPLFIIIRALGLRDTLTALIITYTTFTLPLTIWILTSFFKDIPHEIYMASMIDGCTPFQSFYKIILPLSLPGIITTAILVFIFSWNEFLFALTFTSTIASRTIPVAIALFPGLHEIPWGDIASASITVTIPLILFVLFFQKRIIAGITAGAIKG